MANAEFGQSIDNMIKELARTGGITQPVADAVAGCATVCAAVTNTTLEDLNSKMTIVEMQVKENQEMTMKMQQEGYKKNDKKTELWMRVSEKNGEKHVPDKWEGRNSKTTFREVRRKIENWADAVYPHGVEILKFVEFKNTDIKAADVVAMIGDHADIVDAAMELRDFDKTLYRT